MNLKEKLNREQENTGKIYLYKEGIFVRCYNVSLYYFVSYVRSIKVLVKHIKNNDTPIVYGGIPLSSFEKLMEEIRQKGYELKALKEHQEWEIEGIPSDKSDYASWLNASVKNNLQNVNVTTAKPTVLLSDEQIKVLEMIKNYPLASKSPIEVMQFLSELQAKLS